MSVLVQPNCVDHHFGIEVASCLNWEHWQPGGEYTQQITLKNVNLKTKKLKYRCVPFIFISLVSLFEYCCYLSYFLLVLDAYWKGVFNRWGAIFVRIKPRKENNVIQ